VLNEADVTVIQMNSDPNLLGERVLIRKESHGAEDEITVRVFLPRLGASGFDWECRYEIVGRLPTLSGSVRGVDALQAVQLAFGTIATHLEKLSDSGDQIEWRYAKPGTAIFGPSLGEM
jgi:hypothetical protein